MMRTRKVNRTRVQGGGKLCAATLVGASLLLALGCTADRGRCLRSHEEARHHPAHYTHVLAGKVMVPFYIQARDVVVSVCDEFECPSGRWRTSAIGRECAR
jgi:hypothetical protein